MGNRRLYECRSCGRRWRVETLLRQEECPKCGSLDVSTILVPRKSDVAPCVKYRVEGTTRFNRRFVPILEEE